MHRAVVGLLLLLVPAGAPLSAQGWRPTVRLDAAARYDDNPFLLTAARKQSLDPVSPADQQSGRFVDMESATDLVPGIGIEGGLSGPGVGGRSLEVSAELAYDANLWNPRRRHAELALDARQSLGHGSRLRVTADWRPSYFHKTYLRDAVDGNTDGNITPDERRYAAGTSKEVDFRLGYRHRLLRSTDARRMEVFAELEVGYFGRTYDAPFGGRSRSGPGAGLELDVALGRRWAVDLDYSWASLAADVTREVMILDENAFGGAQDFNANGSFTDLAARAFELVDRSRVEQEIGVSLTGELSRAVALELTYGLRLRSFGSEQPFDVGNRDRDDTLNEFGAEFDLRVASGLHLVVGGAHASQNTNRGGDPGATGDVTDYTRNVLSAGLRYRF